MIKDQSVRLVSADKKTPTSPVSLDETMKVLGTSKMPKGDSGPILERLGEIIAEIKKSKKLNKELIAKMNEQIGLATAVFSLENHYLASDAVGENYRPFIIQFAKDLVTEYDCKTPSELSLAEATALAYSRMLELAKEARSVFGLKYSGNEVIGHYTMLFKELDRAQRQYMHALLTLRQLKSPSIELNIRTKNAFIAQNQVVADRVDIRGDDPKTN